MSPITRSLRALLLLLALTIPAVAQSGKRILVYGDSNTWGWVPRIEGFPAARLADSERYAGILATALGSPVTVVVNGLVGRTTDADRAEAIGPVPAGHFNGAAQLPATIAAQGPFDLVVIMLGTNDLAAGQQRQPSAVANATVTLAKSVAAAKDLVFSGYGAPQVLLVAPPPYGDTSRTPLKGLFAVGEKPSRELGAAILKAANAEGIAAFDAGTVIHQVGGIDGIHMTAENHRALGQALAAEVKKLLK